MATLNNITLPVDVLIAICEYTPYRDLLSLSLACRGFHHITQPRIYKSVDLTWDNFWIFNAPPHCRLLRTVLQRRDIAPLIQSVRVGQCVSDAPWHDAPTLNGLELELTGYLGYDSLNPTKAAWLRRLKSGGNSSLEVALAYLLCSLPNLKTLDLNARFESKSPVIREMMESILHRGSIHSWPSKFEALRQVKFYSEYDIRRHEQTPELDWFPNFQWLFYLPSIEQIQASVHESQSSFVWLAYPPIALWLTSLHLHKSHVNEESLRQIFLATPNLKTFEYNFVCDVDCSMAHRSHLDCTMLGNSLSQVKASLETLIISVVFFARTAYDIEAGILRSWGPQDSLGSLSAFPKLKTLTAPLPLLLGWTPHAEVRLADVLPSDLRHFCCTNDMADWDSWAWTDDTVFEQCREYLAAETSLELNCLDLSAERSIRFGDESLRLRLEQLCEDAGVFHDHASSCRDYI